MEVQHRVKLAGTALLVVIATTRTTHAQHTNPSAKPSASIEAVWAREEQYWRLVAAGDIDTYRTLWNDDFRGWPCHTPHSATTATIGDWVRVIRDEKVRFGYTLTREGAADFGDIVVVYYQTPMVYEYPDGRVVDRDRVYKFTHTWRRTGDKWLIIGGMCGQLLTRASATSLEAPRSADSTAIAALEQRIENAMVTRDAAFLDSVYAPTFRFKHSTGTLETRVQRMTSLRRPMPADAPGRMLERTIDSLDVEVLEDIALTTGRIHVRRSGGDPHWQDYTIRYARVYARTRDGAGRWQLATHHSLSDSQGAPPPVPVRR